MDYRLDRTVFKAQTFEEEQQSKIFAEETYIERLNLVFT